MRYSIFCLGLVCLTITSFKSDNSSETYATAIQKITKQLQGRKYEAQLSITFFNSYNSITPLDKQEISFSVFDRFIYYKAGLSEAYANSNYYLAINHKEKTLILNKGNKTNKYVENPFEKMLLDSLLGLAYDTRLISTSDNLKTWRITPKLKEHTISFADFTYDISNYTPKRIEIYYNIPLEKLFGLFPFQKNDKNFDRKQKPKLIIDYKQFDLLTKPDLKKFDFSSYIKFNNGKAEKGTLSTDYKLIDFSNIKNKKS